MRSNDALRREVLSYLGQSGQEIPDAAAACLVLDILHKALSQREREQLSGQLVAFDTAVSWGVREQFADEAYTNVVKTTRELTSALRYAICHLGGTAIEDVSIGAVRAFAATAERIPDAVTYSHPDSLRDVFGLPELQQRQLTEE